MPSCAQEGRFGASIDLCLSISSGCRGGGSLCLGTDLGMGLPFGHGLGSAVVAMRIADRLGLTTRPRVQAYYGCLLFYAGCTTDADVQATLFPDGFTESWTPVMFASQRQSMAGVFRALGAGGGGRVRRSLRAVARFPRAGRGYKRHTEALCEVSRDAGGRGRPAVVRVGYVSVADRTLGRRRALTSRGRRRPAAGDPDRARRAGRQLSATAARAGRSMEVVRERADGAFDPAVVDALEADMLEEPGLGARHGRRTGSAPDTGRSPDRRRAHGAGRVRRPGRPDRALQCCCGPHRPGRQA